MRFVSIGGDNVKFVKATIVKNNIIVVVVPKYQDIVRIDSDTKVNIISVATRLKGETVLMQCACSMTYKDDKFEIRFSPLCEAKDCVDEGRILVETVEEYFGQHESRYIKMIR